MIESDIKHACSSYGIEVKSDVKQVGEHWEFLGILYKEAESTPRLYRAERMEGGGIQVRRIRKRQEG